MRSRTVITALLIMFSVTPAPAAEALWTALTDGGKVVLMRHAAVDRTKGHGTRHTPGDCSQEFNLSAKGRAQAKKIGELFRARGIAVGEVLASPYCRTLETGRLAFDQVSASDALHLIEAQPPGRARDITAQAAKRIGGHAGKANLVLVTHEPNIVALAFASVEPAGMFVLQPKGGEDFDILGRLPAPGN